jgi:hypothetical protein
MVPLHTLLVGPVIKPGTLGLAVYNKRLREKGAEAQTPLSALTDIVPVTNELLKFKLIVSVFELPVTPGGKVQLYCVAPGIDGVDKTTLFCPAQPPDGPFIAVGAGSAPRTSTNTELDHK